MLWSTGEAQTLWRQTVSREIIQVGTSTFQLISVMADLEFLPDDKGFVLGKTPSMIAKYRQHFCGVSINVIFEIGIKRGGGTAFFYETFRPDRLAAIDLGRPALILERWIDDRALRDQIHTFYGVNQGDSARLDEICEQVFAGQPIDLVLDDASHLLEETRASFNALFPRMRPGGAYVIEDWVVLESFKSWEGLLPPQFRDTAPMSDLIKDIVIASAFHSQIISEVVTNSAFVLVRRGEAEIKPGFDIREFAGPPPPNAL